MLTALSFFAVGLVMLTYWNMVRGHSVTLFHCANVVGAVILAPINIVAGLPAQAILNAMFGAVALLAIVGQRDEGGEY